MEFGLTSGLFAWCVYLQSACRTSIDLDDKKDANSDDWVGMGLGSDSSRLEIGPSFLAFTS